MKKILITLLALVILGGCTDARAQLKNKTPYYRVGKETLSDRDLYPFLIDTYGAQVVSSIINDYLYQKLTEGEEIDLYSNITEDLKVWAEAYGLDYYAIFGYASEEDLINEMLEGARLEHILKSYGNSNYENIIQNYLPTKMAVAQFTDLETAEKALKELKSGGDLADIAAKHTTTEIYDGNPLIFTTYSSLPYEVSSYALYAEKADIVDTPIMASDGSLYLVEVISVDRVADQEEIIQELIHEEHYASEAILYYCRLYDVKYYDKTIIDIMIRDAIEYYP